MFKFNTCALLVLLFMCNVFSYGYIRIGNVRESWNTWEAKIDTLKISISEQDLICRVWEEFTLRDPAPDSSQTGDSLELQAYLRLPENSAVDSLYLWINDKPEPGLLMSASSATAIYESIVKRRKDPAILTTYGGNDYYLRIFPFMPGQSRKVRIAFHCAMNSKSTSKNIRFPMDFVDTVGHFELTVKSSRYYGSFPVLDEPQLALQRILGKPLTKGVSANRTNFPQNYLQVSWGPWPTDNTVSSCYSTDNKGMGYFSLLLDPFSLLGMKDRANISLSVAWTPSMVETWNGGTTYATTYSEYFEGERRALHDFITNSLTQGDKFTLCYAGATLTSFSTELVFASDKNKLDACTFIDGCKPIYYTYSYSYYYDNLGNYHYRPVPPPPGRNWLSALYHAFESFKSSDLQPVVLVLDKGNPYYYSENRPAVSALDSTTTAISLHNDHGAVMYVITSYSRLALYKNLINRFGGRVVQSWAGDDMETRLADLTPDIFSVPLTSLAIQVTSSGNNPCLDILGIPQSRIPWNSRVLLSGRTALTDILNISLAGESNGAYVSAFQSISVNAIPDRSPEKIWALNKVNNSPYSYYGSYGSDADEMAAFSLQHNVLTRYSALLALEPGMDTAFAASEQNTSNSWGIRTTSMASSDVVAFSLAPGVTSSGGSTDFPDIIKAEKQVQHSEIAPHISATPNPFTMTTRITIEADKNTAAPAAISIYDITGKKVHSFNIHKGVEGWLTVVWNGCSGNGSRLPQGIYLLKVRMANKMLTHKVILM
ncbi:MAG: hypothetical protein A2268_03060 [Candidatus Raymondbacteria bacterium RifOxyA12_full_50_37]|uniref:VIT domain-containing protein n=1 Tax=Candidatus Raymondbacteria bacterium RIFOXYD12_FULL_49_13 TaxID=1817890 RepID=A0A1F7F9B3_UNCRA|nr:MAG: hypothetical protein A2248_17165 [Candidatus Raymondbacteria bacterium RIFOXYA2_FULL_49_16]OGJ90756.1 MAG: hypothetical protein A2268_03060 [Candidatus Raymondbacteria bacterium RifOxyA12_full_50_37]OGJ92948.1 MAG: hypothetical protein A2350_04925 [Candidatus Raymondbacteria bacterium RifOxyB12_full_50_8]OGJ98393.1 MAG: hypothetical protein A2453_09070 [Candidatus Raymondbacteria bacterium RIFOXYC2_FULL_50_21]OGK03117.1 MAG: hypothetical protein A2519_06905 [Candidatus Raymondbacteria b